ncbi:hypothetical protein DMC30DRAFT_447896, partial [Rhodotorula diobovata]
QGVLRTRDRLGIDSTSRRLSTCCACLLAAGFASLPFRSRFPSIPSTRHPQDAFSRAAPLPWAVAFIPRPRYLSLPPTFLGFHLARAAAFFDQCWLLAPRQPLLRFTSLAPLPLRSRPRPRHPTPTPPLPNETIKDLLHPPQREVVINARPRPTTHLLASPLRHPPPLVREGRGEF